MTKRTTFTTKGGNRVKYHGNFRYFVYGEAVTVSDGDWKTWVEYRTDSIETARKRESRARNESVSFFGIIDTVTGEVVS
jgi:hypothetical protein